MIDSTGPKTGLDRHNTGRIRAKLSILNLRMVLNDEWPITFLEPKFLEGILL
uniref:Uncharacterized protein n=1 Tax=Lepeophtheirus salmonis TaxID=72036 RepID=A0A0K2TQF8_LEPSM